MKRIVLLLALASVVACSDDDSPTAPGDDLIGTWRGVSTTDPESSEEIQRASTLVIRDDGTYRVSVDVVGVSISIEGTWEIVGVKLIIVASAGGVTESTSNEYTIRGNRMTLVDDNGSVEVWERQT